jgi:hypothetical protein
MKETTWKDKVKMNIKYKELKGVRRIAMSQNRVQWREHGSRQGGKLWDFPSTRSMELVGTAINYVGLGSVWEIQNR